MVPGFLEKINKFPHPRGCWEWVGSISHKTGYGKFSILGGTWGAHRVSWMLFKGPIPEGLWLLHKCDTPSCVNPEHLFLGTPKENSQDMVRKGRWNGNRGGTKPGRVLNMKSPHRKLTETQVKEILRSPLGNYQLAKLYPVSAPAIRALRNNKNYYRDFR